MTAKIIKSSGQQEDFDINKLIGSLTRSGAPREIALDIARQVEEKIAPDSRTRDVYRLAKRLLRLHSTASGMRYAIKKAIFKLGPSGYPFEKYFARILKSYGYSVELGKFIDGYCVRHEVDVVAKNADGNSMIECKYHSYAGKPTDVKAALYVHARFEDIKKAFNASVDQKESFHSGWLVTNTRCTSDAIKYAECAGLRIVSWKYPESSSLERMIEDKGLYPVTILHSAGRRVLDSLFRADIVLAQDVADLDENILVQKSGLEKSIARALKSEAAEICPRVRL